MKNILLVEVTGVAASGTRQASLGLPPPPLELKKENAEAHVPLGTSVCPQLLIPLLSQVAVNSWGAPRLGVQCGCVSRGTPWRLLFRGKAIMQRLRSKFTEGTVYGLSHMDPISPDRCCLPCAV